MQEKLDTARLLYIAVVLLRYREREAWSKNTIPDNDTDLNITRNITRTFFRQKQAGTPAATENMDDIDIALGGILIMADKTQNVKTRLRFLTERQSIKQPARKLTAPLKCLILK